MIQDRIKDTILHNVENRHPREPDRGGVLFVFHSFIHSLPLFRCLLRIKIQ